MLVTFPNTNVALVQQWTAFCVRFGHVLVVLPPTSSEPEPIQALMRPDGTTRITLRPELLNASMTPDFLPEAFHVYPRVPYRETRASRRMAARKTQMETAV